MPTLTLTAMFNANAEAERAGDMLASELRVDRAMIRTSPGAGVTDAGYNQSRPYEEKGFFGSLRDLSVPDEDRHTYAEGMRRGSVLLSAQVEDSQLQRASGILEQAGAIDLDAQEAAWRKSGWAGYNANTHNAMRSATPTAAMPAASGRDVQGDTIKVVEEHLVIGKRLIEHGSVRVRVYVIERPVEAQVTLRDETVRVEHHPVNRPLTAADADAFREKTIEAHEVDEEAVVSKEARIVEEITIRKDVADRVETVRDTVRKTEVNVEDLSGTAPAGGTSTEDMAGAVDRSPNTNVSGASSSADAPDGTPGNPSGTAASRAVDRTLGTNISGANPGRK